MNHIDNDGWTPLIEASNEIVQFLVERGADVNQVTHNGETSLYKACQMHNMELLEYLSSNTIASFQLLDVSKISDKRMRIVVQKILCLYKVEKWQKLTPDLIRYFLEFCF